MCVSKCTQEYLRVAEALCLEPLLQQVPVPFISKSSSTPTNTQRKEKAKCVERK